MGASSGGLELPSAAAREGVECAGPRLRMKELRDPLEYEGEGRGRHFGVSAKGCRCKRDSFICLLQETDEGAGAVGLWLLPP
jgi:hypothetical protein